MKDDRLPDEDHVSRYCKPSEVSSDGLPLTGAFELREGQDHLSVNWLEFFDEPDLDAMVTRIREAFAAKGYTVRPNGRFTVLNVGAAIEAAHEGTDVPLRVLHLPEDDDLSHSGVVGYTVDDFAVAVELRALVTADDIYPAVSEIEP